MLSQGDGSVLPDGAPRSPAAARAYAGAVSRATDAEHRPQCKAQDRTVRQWHRLLPPPGQRLYRRAPSGAQALAHKVVEIIDQESTDLTFAYEDEDSLERKIELVAKKISKCN